MATLGFDLHSTHVVIVLREEVPILDYEAIEKLLATANVHAQGLRNGPQGSQMYITDAESLPTSIYDAIAAHPSVAHILPCTAPYILADRAWHKAKTIVNVGTVQIGASTLAIIAGPCSVETKSQITRAARAAKNAGAHILRGGCYKPRTSPYSFQGLGLRGIKLLAEAGASVGMPVVTEVMEPAQVNATAALVDMLQIGSRSMQNTPLLRAVGRSGKPILLKRGFAATLEEWLSAAEYILAEGNPNVVLCERGIRSFDANTRFLLDLSCIPTLSFLTHLPVVVDPSHGTGHRDLVMPMGLAAIGAGADGLMVEMHPSPDKALSDAEQAIEPRALRNLIDRAVLVRTAVR